MIQSFDFEVLRISKKWLNIYSFSFYSLFFFQVVDPFAKLLRSKFCHYAAGSLSIHGSFSLELNLAFNPSAKTPRSMNSKCIFSRCYMLLKHISPLNHMYTCSWYLGIFLYCFICVVSLFSLSILLILF